MNIDHIAIWTTDLDRLRDFYVRFFNCAVSDKYVNVKKSFSSYFLSFAGYDARIEIMQRPNLSERCGDVSVGLAHLAISVGTPAQVDALTRQIELSGYVVESYPRRTGDGYYESVIRDPDNNLVELVAATDYLIIPATEADLPQILYLQKCCYLSEAELYNNYTIAPLTQDFEGIKKDFDSQRMFKLVCNSKIVGSIRAFELNNTCYVGKLMVERTYQNKGFGKLLLQTVEKEFPSVARFELFTGFRSVKNLHLYTTFGYKEFKEEETNGVVIKFLEKIISRGY